MHPTDANQEPDLETPPPRPGRIRRRIASVLIVVLVILLLVVIPPLFNVSRLQRRIATNISTSLGRPVHFSSVKLNLLPLPGFTLENFVVEEDPAYGFEPTLSADEVRATLRLSSLWRPHIEFATISLTNPSVNLVRNPDGHWNIEGVLLKASHIEAAPTVQRYPGPAPRFPYIEATGARLNLKLGQEKTPFSLTNADFALWLPGSRQWRFRVEAHPTRTDANPGDTGTLRIQGSLGSPDSRAASLPQVPIDIHATWQDAQLGAVSQLLLSRDAGLRGSLTFDLGILGTLGHNSIDAHLTLDNTRRADFIPTNPLSLQAGCQAIAQNTFHAFSDIQCHWPPTASSQPPIALLSADLPDVRKPHSAYANVTIPSVLTSTLLDWISVATPRPPTVLQPTGTLAGSLFYRPLDASGPPQPQPSAPATAAERPTFPTQPASQTLTGELDLTGETLRAPGLGPKPIPLGTVTLTSTAPIPPRKPRSRHAAPAAPPAPAHDSTFYLLPIELPLGGHQPATLEGHVNRTGYTLHLSGTVLPDRLLALAATFPQFGDGLKQCIEPEPALQSAPPAAPSSQAAPSKLRPAGSSTPQPAKELSSNPAGTDQSAPPAQPKNSPTPSVAEPIHIDLTAARDWGHAQTWCPPASTPPASTPPAAPTRHSR